MQCEWDRSGFFPVRSRLTPRHDRSVMDSWPKCVPCTLVPPECPPFPGWGVAQLVPGSCQASCTMPTKLWHGCWDCCYLQRESHGEQALWKRLFWWNHAAQQGDFYRERGQWKCCWWLRAVVLVGNELMWVMLITASPLNHTVILVSIHQLHIDSLSHIPAKGEVDVMEYHVSVFLMLLFMQVKYAMWWRGSFVKVCIPWRCSSWGLWTDVCDSFYRELIGLVEWICQMFPSLQLHAVLDVMWIIRMKTINSIRNSTGSWSQAQCQVWYAFVTEKMHCSSKWRFLSMNAVCLRISNDYSPAEKWHSHE